MTSTVAFAPAIHAGMICRMMVPVSPRMVANRRPAPVPMQIGADRLFPKAARG